MVFIDVSLPESCHFNGIILLAQHDLQSAAASLLDRKRVWDSYGVQVIRRTIGVSEGFRVEFTLTPHKQRTATGWMVKALFERHAVVCAAAFRPRTRPVCKCPLRAGFRAQGGCVLDDIVSE